MVSRSWLSDQQSLMSWPSFSREANKQRTSTLEGPHRVMRTLLRITVGHGRIRLALSQLACTLEKVARSSPVDHPMIPNTLERLPFRTTGRKYASLSTTQRCLECCATTEPETVCRIVPRSKSASSHWRPRCSSAWLRARKGSASLPRASRGGPFGRVRSPCTGTSKAKRLRRSSPYFRAGTTWPSVTPAGSWRTSSHASWTILRGPWQKPAGRWAGSWRSGVTRRRSVRTKPRGPARK